MKALSTLAVVLTFLTDPARAALIDRGNGLIYDSDLDISWLADANLAATNNFGVSGIQSGGFMSFGTASAFVAAVNAASYLGFNDWRLPTSPQPDPSCSVQNVNGSTGTGCTGSELGHLFYVELGGSAGSSILSSGDPDLALFRNIVAATTAQLYWTSTLPANVPNAAYAFTFQGGVQSIAGVRANEPVWLVRDGDSVPEPSAIALLAVAAAALGLRRAARRSRSLPRLNPSMFEETVMELPSTPARRSLVRRSALLAAALVVALAPRSAYATPIITSFAQFNGGTLTDSRGPQTGGTLTSSVSTTSSAGASLCGIAGGCPPGQNPNANSVAAQDDTLSGTFSAVRADGSFFGGSSSLNSLIARTTWQDTALAGQTSIRLDIDAAELVLSDFASINFSSPSTARYRIELTVNGSVVFFSEAILRAGLALTESGFDLGGVPFGDPSFPSNIAGYHFSAAALNLSVNPGDVVLYTMEVQVTGPGFETGGFARVGDPFNLAGGGSRIAFVPEPVAASLLAVGLGGLAFAGRRRARAAPIHGLH